MVKTKVYEEFLKLTKEERVAYLLKLAYYISRANEQDFCDYILEHNINRQTCFYFETKLGGEKSFHLIDRIIKEGYNIKLVDIKTSIDSLELYKLLSLLINDIKSIDKLNPSLKKIKYALTRNLEFIMNNYLNSVNYIMHTITDPFTNTKYLAKCMDNIRDNNFFNYVCTSTFLDTDKRPVEDSFDFATYLKIVIEFQIAYIRRILSYYKLPMEDREKYFNSNFLSNLDDTFIQEIKSITVDDLIAFNNRNRVRPVKTLSQLFPDKSERFTSFLIDLGRATSFDVEHARSSHFFGICCGGPYGETMPYTHRIYIYTEQDSLSRVLFLREYILKCIDAGINYDIKGKGSDDADAKYSKDSTVLYIEKVEDVPRVLKILDTIGKEHPEWINNFGSPLWNCGQLNGSYYSFGFGLSVKDNTRKDELGRSHLYGFETYNGVFDKYLREAYQIYLEKVSSMGKIDRQKRVALFQEILYEVKKQIQIKDYQTIYNLSLLEENKEAADSILHVREAYEKYGMRVRYNKNGCSNIITDCYVAHERELIRELVELYESVDKDKVDSPSVDIKNKK